MDLGLGRWIYMVLRQHGCRTMGILWLLDARFCSLSELGIAFLIRKVVTKSLHSDTNCIGFHIIVNPRTARVAEILKSPVGGCCKPQVPPC